MLRIFSKINKSRTNIKNMNITTKSNWKDPLNINSLLTSEEIMIKNTAKSYANDKLMPRILQANRKEIFDKNILKELGSLGLIGSTIQGSSYVSYGIIAKEIEKIDSAYRSAFSVQSSLVIYPINTFFSRNQSTTRLVE